MKTPLRKTYRTLLIFAFLATTLTVNAHAAGSLLRVSCEGDDVGAEVTVNGEFKGECPVDIQVAEGMITVRAAKIVDAQHEESFEQEIRIGNGTVKKVAIILSAPHLNAVAQKNEDDRRRQEQEEAARQEEARQQQIAAERRRNDELLSHLQQAATAGDPEAMLELGKRYENGLEVEKNKEEAIAWYRKVAASGNEVAIFKLSLFAPGTTPKDIDAVVRLLQMPSGVERKVSIEGEEKIRAFVTSDPFFEVPGGHQVETFSYEKSAAAYMNDTTINVNGTCGREAGFFVVKSKTEYGNINISTKSSGVLGGLIALEGKSSKGFFDPSTTSKLLRIETLRGQPFPLSVGRRFAITYASKVNNAEQPPILLTCSLDDAAAPTTGQPGEHLLCLTQLNLSSQLYSIISRPSWHQTSGCFLEDGGK